MATLTIRNVPDVLYGRLKARAARHRRSLEREALMILENGVDRSDSADAARVLARVRRLWVKRKAPLTVKHHDELRWRIAESRDDVPPELS